MPWTLLAAAGLWLALRRHLALGPFCCAYGSRIPGLLFSRANTRYRYPID